MAVLTKVGSFNKIDTTGAQTITGLGFTPKAIVFWTTGAGDSNGAPGVWEPVVHSTMGFTTGPTNSFACGTTQQDAQTASNTYRRMAAKCLSIPDVGTGAYVEADLTSFNADGFTITYTSNVAGTLTGATICFMALGGPDITGAKIVNWLESAAAGNQAVTGVGFSPDLVLHAHITHPTAPPITATDAYLAIGAMNKHGQQWANSVFSQVAVNPSNTSRFQQTDACIISTGATEVVNAQAHFVSMDADGFTVNKSTATTQQQIISLCLKGVSSELGSFSKPTAVVAGNPAIPQVINRVGFTPRAVFGISNGTTSQGSPTAQATLSMGASDGFAHRAAMFTDGDAITPTQARSVFFNDAVFAEHNGLGVTGSKATAVLVGDGFDMLWTTNDTTASEHLYLAIGDAGVGSYPSSIGATTQQLATGYSSQRKLDRSSNGVLHTTFSSGAGANETAYLYYSTDAGLTWNYGGIDSIQGATQVSMFIDQDDNLHVVWKQNGTAGGTRTAGYLYYIRATPNAARTLWTYGTAQQFGNAADTSRAYPDVVAHREGTGWKAHVVASYTTGATSNYADYARFDITSANVITRDTFLQLATDYAFSSHTYPSIDFNHTGDGKTVAGGTPHLYMAWSAGKVGAGFGIRFKKATYSAGVWTFGTEREIDNTQYVFDTARWLNCLFDGTRVIIVGFISNAGNAAYILTIYDRDVADTTTTSRVLSGAGTYLINGSATYDAQGNVWLIGRSNTINGFWGQVFLRRWTRATGVLTDYVITDQMMDNVPTSGMTVTFKRGYSGNRLEWLYVHGNQNPWTVKYDYLSLVPLGRFRRGTRRLADGLTNVLRPDRVPS